MANCMDWLLTGFCHFLVDSDKIYPSQISEILLVVSLTASGSQVHYRLVSMLANKIVTIYCSGTSSKFLSLFWLSSKYKLKGLFIRPKAPLSNPYLALWTEEKCTCLYPKSAVFARTQSYKYVLAV